MHLLLYLGKGLLGGKGGTEKVILNFANYFSKLDYQVSLVTNDAVSGPLMLPLDPAVTFVNIGGTGFIGWQHWRYQLLNSCALTRKLLHRHPNWHQLQYTSNLVRQTLLQLHPDIVLTASPADTLELGYQQPNYPFPIIQMLHCAPKLNFKRRSHKVFTATLATVQQHVNVVQILQPQFSTEIQQYYSGPIAIIPNAIQPVTPTQQASYTLNKTKYVITYLARLCPIKQQDLLLRAWASLANHYPQWELQLWGTGTEQFTHYLQRLILQLNLSHSTKLCGFTTNPASVLQHTDICALPSASEGFFLALGEAMATGLPVVAIAGVGNLITDQVNGLLSQNDPEDLAKKLRSLIESPQLRRQLGEQAKLTMQQYSPDKVWSQWQTLLEQVVQEYQAKSPSAT